MQSPVTGASPEASAAAAADAALIEREVELATRLEELRENPFAAVQEEVAWFTEAWDRSSTS